MSATPGPFAPQDPADQEAGRRAWELAEDETMPLYHTDLDAPSVDTAERDMVLTHLRGGQVLVMAAGYGFDMVDGSRSVPVGIAYDGQVRWTLSAEHHLARHGVGVPGELVAHIRRRRGQTSG